MTLLTVFNNALKEVENNSKILENMIADKDWDEQKKLHAVKIVRQIREGHMLAPYQGISREFLGFSKLELVLSSDGAVGDVLVNGEYVRELVDDINKISPTIRFRLIGYTPKRTQITYEIGWEI